MNGIAVLVSLAAVGVDYGWQPTADGQLEYIIQIEPNLLESLRNGDEIVSEILPQARGVRKFRIRVGSGPVPRVGTGPEAAAASTLAPRGMGDRSRSGILAPTASVLGSEEFRPDGLLNLPPPPPLLVDGKSSVLVRPGATATTSGPAMPGISSEVLPPREPAVGEPGNAPWSAPPAGTGLGVGGSWTSPAAVSPPATPAFESDLVLPPGDGAAPYDMDVPPSSGELVLPPTEQPAATRPANERPVRPVPSPSQDSSRPTPIRIGDSGVSPPAAEENEMVSHGPFGPDLARSQPDSADVVDTGKPEINPQDAQSLQPPWTPLVMVSLGLFASLAANLYMGWVAAGVYRRYRDVVAQLHRVQTSLA